MAKPIGTNKPLHKSPWQALIEEKRLEKGWSYRRLGEAAQINHMTIYQWSHSEHGHPPRKSYPASTNQRISRALGIDPFALMQAWDESATLFGTRTPDHESSDLTDLLRDLESHPEKTIKKEVVIHRLRSILQIETQK